MKKIINISCFNITFAVTEKIKALYFSLQGGGGGVRGGGATYITVKNGNLDSGSNPLRVCPPRSMRGRISRDQAMARLRVAKCAFCASRRASVVGKATTSRKLGS